MVAAQTQRDQLILKFLPYCKLNFDKKVQKTCNKYLEILKENLKVMRNFFDGKNSWEMWIFQFNQLTYLHKISVTKKLHLKPRNFYYAYKLYFSSCGYFQIKMVAARKCLVNYDIFILKRKGMIKFHISIWFLAKESQ